MLKTSDFGKGMIQAFEGLRTKAYIDSAGVRTIGYGHAYWTGADEISREDANLLFTQDIVRYEQHVNKWDCTYHWTQNEFDAMVSFAFNVGSINQLTADGRRSKAEIAKKMLKYVNSGGKKLTGLVERRVKERDLFVGKLKAEGTPVSERRECCDIVKDVISGKYGNGEERKAKLKAEGFDPAHIQKCVNRALKNA